LELLYWVRNDRGWFKWGPAESGVKSWLKEISTGKPRIPPNCSGNDEPHKQKNAASRKGKRRLFDRDM
jgi:hypothetical protein